MITVTGHRRGRDREQGATQAITDRVDLLVRDNVADRVKRGHGSKASVVRHTEIAIGRTRVAPRDHEHRVALIDQVPDQRVLGREIQDIIFHDPRRHDQHRFGVDGFGGRCVLDQFDQMIAIDHIARGDGQVAADLKGLGTDRWLA